MGLICAEWTQVCATAAFSARRQVSLVATPTKIYAIGGYDGTNLFNDIWVSADDGSSWTLQCAATSFTSLYSGCVSFGELLVSIPGNSVSKVWKSTDGSNWQV